ncbi:MAG: N-6 DNA methylase [Candidatus Lokiarchaeota archaeon]|nr:N-6 DNA methylase [Candidatus Lokiarchaeota archaeon]
MISDEIELKIMDGFQRARKIIFQVLRENFGGIYSLEMLRQISFLSIFYLFLLNFKDNNSFLQVVDGDKIISILKTDSKIKSALDWKDFIDLSMKFQIFNDDESYIFQSKKDDSKKRRRLDFYKEIFKKISVNEKKFEAIKEQVIISEQIDPRKFFHKDLILLLGRIYEQSLKNDLDLKQIKNRKKSLGKYYTPKNVARYIIEKCYKQYIEKNPISFINDLLNIKILDPSMGAGIFLTEMLDYLLQKRATFLQTEKYVDLGIKITKNCLYGVDIDPIAVELARWSLFLYLDTDKEIINTLKKRLKVGNSLFNINIRELIKKYPRINELTLNDKKLKVKLLKIYINSCLNSKPLVDFEDLLKRSLLNKKKFPILLKNYQLDEKSGRIFLWEQEFPEIFNGLEAGFDIIIGNPPHLGNKQIQKQIKRFLKSRLQNYTTTIKLYDYTIPFIELSFNLLKKNGILGFITANKFLSTDYGYNLRNLLLEKTEILHLLDISNFNIFKNALSYPIILIFRKESKKNIQHKIKIGIAKSENYSDINIDENFKFYSTKQLNIKKIPNKIIPLSSNIHKLLSILKKENVIPLRELCKFKYRPLRFTGWGKYLDHIQKNKRESEVKILKFIGCGNLEPFGVDWNKTFRLLRTKFKRSYIKKPPSVSEDKWRILEKEKILIREIAQELTAAYDSKGEYGNITGLYMLYDCKISPYYLTAILNSKILNEIYNILFGSVHLQGGYLNYHSSYLKILPILLISLDADRSPIKTHETNKNALKNLRNRLFKEILMPSDIKKEFLNRNLEEVYRIIIRISKKLHQLVDEKIENINKFHELIEKELRIKIIGMKKRSRIVNFYKYRWNEVLKTLEINKNLYKISNAEFEKKINIIQINYEKKLEIHEQYMKKYSIIKINLDKIITFYYLN